MNTPPTPSESATIVEHYGATSLTTRINDALTRAGFGDAPLSWEDLVPLDQFHVRGIVATRELAAGMNLSPGASILDIGCGIGGASRFLAATYNARVTGIDLTPPFVDAATMLSARAGLADRTAYRVADALDLPFDDASFDNAWTQHVAMNVGDRPTLYREIRRVMKPGGLFAIHDVVALNGQPLHFPVPWARVSTASHLLTSDATSALLVDSGFEIVSSADTTEATKSWIAKLLSQRSANPAPTPLGLGVITGPDFPTMFGNLERNLNEGRVGLVQIYARAVARPTS
jgi:ubiquinone/menaquinone biosynthesis C-methylase UbiE